MEQENNKGVFHGVTRDTLCFGLKALRGALTSSSHPKFLLLLQVNLRRKEKSMAVKKLVVMYYSEDILMALM